MVSQKRPFMDKCRCCLQDGELRNMWEDHDNEGEERIYGDMMNKCFAICWQKNEEETEQICESCIRRLQDAVDFKKMVLTSEQIILEYDEGDDEMHYLEEMATREDSEHRNKYVDVEYLEVNVPSLPQKDTQEKNYFNNRIKNIANNKPVLAAKPSCWNQNEVMKKGIKRENEIDAANLSLLGRDVVTQFIKPIGDQARLMQNLELWKNICNENYSSTLNKSIEFEVDPFALSHEESRLNHEEVCVLNPKHKEINLNVFRNLITNNASEAPAKQDVRSRATTSSGEDTLLLPLSPDNTREGKIILDILNQSAEGKNILKLHKEEGLLTSYSRRKLCNLIIQHLLLDDPNARVSQETLFKYAQGIKRVFKKENVSTYFVPYVNNKKMKIKACAKGKLYDCLHNRKREYRCADKKQNVQMSKTQENDDALQNTEDLGSIEDLQLNIQWLKNSTEPWELVETKWDNTTKIRYTSDKSIEKYMSEFPSLQKPAGFHLLRMDFKNLYPGKENLLYENFPVLKDKILRCAIHKADRDLALKAIVQALETLSETDDVKTTEVKSIAALLSLPLLLGNPLAKARKSTWRPSKQEACEGFITHIFTTSELQTTIARRKDKFKQHNITLQPFIVIVGRDYATIEKYYVVINDTSYLLNTILDAVDVCYKTFHVLNCRYPVECVSTWQFIQKGLYKMHTPWDKNFVSINSFLTDIGVQIE